LIVAAFASALHAGGSAALQWAELGPAGGSIAAIAAGPGGKVFALAGGVKVRVFASADDGLHWAERAPPPGCSSLAAFKSAYLLLHVRGNGDVFLHCANSVLRSRDDARTWSLFGPPNFEGQLEFDPQQLTLSAIRRWNDAFPVIASSSLDGVAWSIRYPDYNESVPGLIAWDPLQRGRLVAVGTEVLFVASHSEYLSRYYESRDNGAHWSPVSVIVPQRPDRGPCYEVQFLLDPAGRAYLINGCGFMRSLDGGATWELVASIAGGSMYNLGVDPADPTRLLVVAAGRLYESRDMAASWQALPPSPAPVLTYAASAAGRLFIATPEGVFVFDTASGAWLPRSAGLHAQPLDAVEIAGDLGTTLLGLRFAGSPVNVRSLDGGDTWSSFKLDDVLAAGFARNVTVPSSVVALTDASALYASADGGGSWSRVAAMASSGPGERIVGIVPFGPQPGLVYGLWQICVPSGFGGCFFGSQGVAKSTNGGATWSHTAATPGGFGFGMQRVVVSPADANTAMVDSGSSLFVTRDGGAHWEERAKEYARVIPDPGDPTRWYKVDQAKRIAVTNNAGVQWSQLSDPPVQSGSFDLLVDPRDPRRLFAVGSLGDVSMSLDRGATWQLVLAPSPTLLLTQNSARFGQEPVTTIYAAAAQGVVRLVALVMPGPIVMRAIEYYRAGFDHYFVTASAQEIEQLDKGALAGWARTGESFNVFATSTAGSLGVSPVCRFYGKPEKGLDTHFYSASPAECQSVKDRFADAWIYESPSVFEVYLPAAADGACPSATSPLYRVYNNRPDANHRYTTSLAVRQTMLAAGWTAEGYGNLGVAMCVP
jgi:photosystem II stability/assembly factor-like uncharacterized protein